MSGITALNVLLKKMQPVLDVDEYVFCVTNQKLNMNILELNPICTIQEEEGLTLILKKKTADKAKLKYEGVYSKISLLVHSSLEAVGLTAAFSKTLTEHDISANVVAGYYHDHIFVPSDKAEQALVALKKLS